MAILQVNKNYLVLILHMFWERSFRMIGTSVLQVGCPSCHPTNSVGALKGIESTDLQPGKIIHWYHSFSIHPLTIFA